jgi:CheY-like chemotaxis protein
MMGPRQRPTILVVEDDHDIREALVELLATFDYVATAVSNGAEALEYLSRAPLLPSLIVLDLMMPIMDGYTFNEERMQIPRLAALPVLVLSADLNARQRLGGALPILRKPAEMEEFVSTIERLLAA